MKTFRSALLSLSLSAVALSGLACQGVPTEEEAMVGEATSYLEAGEETGDLGGEAAGVETDAEITELAGEGAALPPLGTAVGEGAGVCNPGARRARVIAHYDADGDGQLSPAERQALKADLEDKVGHPIAVRFALRHRVHVMKRLKWAFDENSDGVLSTDERTALHDAMQARCERIKAAILERFDANGDGRLDEVERQAVRDAFHARVAAIRARVLAKYDLDQSGALEEPERQALKADLVALYQARRAALVAHFDANGDGVLDDGEKLALKQAIQQRVAEGRDAE